MIDDEVWETWIEFVCTVSSLVSRMIHHWRSDHLTGHILNLHVHIPLPLANDVPWGFWT